MPEFKIRSAVRLDCPALLSLKKESALHQKLSGPMLTIQELERDGFDSDPPLYHCCVAETSSGDVVAFALYFFGYTAFEGKVLHLEDLSTSAQMRGKGIGKAIIRELAKIGKGERCARLQLEVHEENSSALAFYDSLGGVDTTVIEGWHNFRLNGEAIRKLAEVDSL